MTLVRIAFLSFIFLNPFIVGANVLCDESQTDNITEGSQQRQFFTSGHIEEHQPVSQQGFQSHYTEFNTPPDTVDWQLLMDLEYELKYFDALEMEIYAPVFRDAHKALDGKEVVIEGFVIPFDEEGDLLSLSFNPYASCFFCGKASPASVISMYLKDDSKRYKMDDYKKFRGTLHLNNSDPNEFYYILRDAREEKE